MPRRSFAALAALAFLIAFPSVAAAADALPTLPAPAETEEAAPPPPPPSPRPAPNPQAVPVQPAAEIPSEPVESPSGCPNGRGAHCHDGFYLRVALGPAYTRLSGSSPSGDISASGDGAALSLALGGTVAAGAVLAFLVTSAATSQNTTLHNVNPSGDLQGSAAVVGIDALFDWYPKPDGGWHVGAALGFGGVVLDGPVDSATSVALGGSILGGYDWWIGEEWSLGLLGVLSGAHDASLTNQGVDTLERAGGVSFAVEGSILFH